MMIQEVNISFFNTNSFTSYCDDLQLKYKMWNMNLTFKITNIKIQCSVITDVNP